MSLLLFKKKQQPRGNSIEDHVGLSRKADVIAVKEIGRSIDMP